MKKLISIISTAIFITGVTFAQSNSTNLEQVGTSANTSLIMQQDGGQNIVTGPSPYNHAYQSTKDGSNSFTVHQSLGTDMYNYINMYQVTTGKDNTFDATQTNPGSDILYSCQNSDPDNSVVSLQTGTGGYNKAMNLQNSTTGANSFSLTQVNTLSSGSGHTNYAGVNQAAHGDNYAKIEQNGTDNVLENCDITPAAIPYTWSDFGAAQTSSNGNNSLTLTQTGTGKTAGLHQEAIGDNTASIIQNSTGTDMAASYQVSTGSYNSLNIMQSGATNNSSQLLQTGPGMNTGTIYQH